MMSINITTTTDYSSKTNELINIIINHLSSLKTPKK